MLRTIKGLSPAGVWPDPAPAEELTSAASVQNRRYRRRARLRGFVVGRGFGEGVLEIRLAGQRIAIHRVTRFQRFGSLLKEICPSRVPAVRAGQWPVLARNDPLNIVGSQRQQTLSANGGIRLSSRSRIRTPILISLSSAG